ncbi:hypothetical protein [Dongshaea marina]|uniref:hypothetical protein n=1 Tax=Dongshaea marina TaxID=2047966 RepID=UPI000D3E1331|nr:hypothetical protein [Dongshaea marina]
MSVSQSVSLEALTDYFRAFYDEDQARAEAREAWYNLKQMRQQGYIDGWFFDRHGYLALEPSGWVVERFSNK